MEAKLGDTALTLVANWKTSLEVAERVGDPMMIAREAVKEAVLLEKGLPFRPDFVLTTENVAEIIHIGVNAGDTEMSLDRIGELIFDAGIFAGKEIATDYLAMIIGPQSKEMPKKKGDKRSEK